MLFESFTGLSLCYNSILIYYNKQCLCINLLCKSFCFSSMGSTVPNANLETIQLNEEEQQSIRAAILMSELYVHCVIKCLLLFQTVPCHFLFRCEAVCDE